MPSYVIYDWDNTLVDAWPGVTAAMNVAFAAFAMPAWTEAETKARARRSLTEAFPPLFGPDWPRARDLFHAAYQDQHTATLRPLAGSAALIAGFPPARQAVVSNKTGRFLRAEAAHLGWTGSFTTLIGAGDAAADKPDAAPILLALQRLGAASDTARGAAVWYVGDTALDMQAARAAGVTAVLLGDAAHDGGVDHAAPDLHFPDAAFLLRVLAGVP